MKHFHFPKYSYFPIVLFQNTSSELSITQTKSQESQIMELLLLTTFKTLTLFIGIEILKYTSY